MIPKTIHYCWFGGNPLPKDAQKCIASWRKYLPEYEIKQWDESNFDVNAIPYTAQAYAAKKYAFVSDYARFKILYEHGGVYFDTDVEVIKPMEGLIARGPFMGMEKTHYGVSGVNPGLGIALEAKMPIIREILDWYEANDYTLNTGTVVTFTTDILKNYGYRNCDEEQQIANVTIYTSEVLCPMDSTTGITKISPSTVSIHHYSCTWMNRKSIRFRLHLLKNKINRLIGKKIL